MMAESGMGSNTGGIDAAKEKEQSVKVACRTNLVECIFFGSLFC
jgi:hypothetical protein